MYYKKAVNQTYKTFEENASYEDHQKQQYNTWVSKDVKTLSKDIFVTLNIR